MGKCLFPAYRISRLPALTLVVVVTLHVAIALAQSSGKFEKGDKIQIYFLGGWIDAVVADTNRTQVLAEYEFAGRVQQRTYKFGEVRFKFEENAIGRAKFWSDQTGKFRIRAALIRIDDANVTLRKEDLQEVTVPIKKLSNGDQAYLKRLEKELGPAAQRPAAAPSVEEFDINDDSLFLANSGTGRAAIQPDLVPAYQKLNEGGVAFAVDDFHDRLGAVIPLGGRGSYLLAAIEGGPGSKGVPTRLLWAALEERKVAGRQQLPPGEVVLDYHAKSHRLLTYASIKSEGDFRGKPVLTVWEVLPKDKQAKPIVRWNAAAESVPREPWARMIDANTVLHRWTNQQYVGWDIEAKAMKYKFDQESFFAPTLTLSGSHRYVFVPEDKQVRIIEGASGQVVSVLPSPQGASGIGVTEDGRLAAVLSRNALTVWDLTDETAEPEVYQAEAVGTPFSAELRWVGDRRVMVDQGSWGQVLFSLDLRLPLWNYQFDSSAVSESDGRRMRDVIDGHLVYAASLRSGSERGLAVGAVKLPGPKVEEAAGSLDREALNIMKPGSRVSLDVKCGTHNAEVRAALEEQVADNQWVLNTSAPARLVAEMGRSESQTVTYRMFTGGEQSATITPYYSRLKVTIGEKVAWQSGTSTGAPPMIHLREGETVQSELTEWEKPNPGYFGSVDLPAKLLDPDKKKGLGVTKVTTRGLEAEE